MKLSIVIPIYNVENYLPECLDSVIKQKRVDEIICVNDGSTDHSLDIIKEFERKDDRIKVIDKPNSGYGDSVNQGIAIAIGDYVGILESDDIAVDNAYAEMMEAADATEADIVKGNFNTLETSTGRIVYQNNLGSFEYDRVISYKENKTLIFTVPSIWSAIYKKSFLTDKEIQLLATPGASYQDTSFVFKAWIASEKIYLINTPVVNYRCDSIGSSSNSGKKVFNIFNELEEMQSFLQERNLKQLIPLFMRLKFSDYIWTLSRLNAEGKAKVLARCIPELRDELYKGYLRREFWDDFNWNLMHTLLFNREKALEYIQGCSIAGDEYDYNPSCFLKKASPIYIYGAGKAGVKKQEELLTNGIHVSAFIVTETGENPSEVNGTPVLPLDKIDRDGVIILGVGAKHRDGVLDALKKEWLLNNVVEVW